MRISEKKEPMFITWGRIRAMVGISPYGKAKLNPKRLEELVEKFNVNLSQSKVLEGYFKGL